MNVEGDIRGIFKAAICHVLMNQQDAQILANNLFYFTVFYLLYTFRTKHSSIIRSTV